MANRPNILLITSDQQRADCYGFRGRKVKTPHLDRMAAGGTHFTQCITPNVVCQPSRTSILTGLLPLSHGVVDNGIDITEELAETGFSRTLANSGYKSAFVGKTHFSTKGTFHPTGRPECHFSSADYPEDWTGPYMGFDYIEMMCHGHFHKKRNPVMPPVGQHFERWYYGHGNNGQEVWDLWAEELAPITSAAQTWHSALPAQWHTSTWVGDRTVDFLSRHDDKDPFVLWASFPDPHHPFDCPEPWSRMHNPEEVDISTIHNKDLERRPWWHKASLESEPDLDDPELLEFRKHGSRCPDQTEAQLRDMTANYYGMISLIDHNVGRIFEALETNGQGENTIVIYTTDHGDMLGDHGLYLKGPTHYEALLNVGLIFKGPGVPAGKIVDEPVSTLDLAATFYDYASIEKHESIQSESLRELVEGDGSRDAAYNEWNVNASRCGVPLILRTIRTKTHKCTFELESGAGELYDLVNDPNEMDNLFDDTAASIIRKELTEMMQERPGAVLKEFAEPVGAA